MNKIKGTARLYPFLYNQHIAGLHSPDVNTEHDTQSKAKGVLTDNALFNNTAVKKR